MSHFLDDKAELTSLGRKVTWTLVGLYALAICYMCFGPQHTVDGIETPNIIYWGRLRLLLVPFNTLLSFGQLEGGLEIFWVIGQNLLNILLLFPLLLGMLALYPDLRSWKKIIWTAFRLSLFIECTQLILDFLFDADRVFEVDDLWTNSLGGALAFITYRFLQEKFKKK